MCAIHPTIPPRNSPQCAALRYLMKSDGFARVQQKQVFVFMRESFLDLVSLDLDRKGLDDFNDSDLRLIKLVTLTLT